MLLNMLLTRNCNYNCLFCIEKTKEDIKDSSSPDIFLRKANYLIDSSLIDEVLLLGGEPLYYPYITGIINGLHINPIITTNAHRLLDAAFCRQLDFKKIKAMNISIHHYDPYKRREVTGSSCLSNADLERIVRQVGIPIRMNALLMKDYIGSEQEINRMIMFARAMGIQSIKFSELTGVNESTHDFVDAEVLKYNQLQYCQIPVREMREKCHEFGGSHFYKSIDGIGVFFNSAPDFALAGGKDKRGRYYHAVLFNDLMMGFSWRRNDGIYENEKELLRIARENLSQPN